MYWRSHNCKEWKFEEKQRFDCERHVELTKAEKQNLLALKRFRMFQWFVDNESLKQGSCFGHQSFESNGITSEGNPFRKGNAFASEDTFLAVLTREDFMTVMNMQKRRADDDNVSVMKKVPFLSKLSFQKVKKLMMISEEQVL